LRGRAASNRWEETAIDRRDFGATGTAAMNTGGAYFGERVQISFAIMAVRQDSDESRGRL
jgi:hypothetical protein